MAKATTPTASSHAKCVGCGYCCTKIPCHAAMRIHGNHIKACPELKWDKNRHVCSLMQRSGHEGRRYREELYAGEGCCSSLNTWRQDIRDRTRREEP